MAHRASGAASGGLGFSVLGWVLALGLAACGGDEGGALAVTLGQSGPGDVGPHHRLRPPGLAAPHALQEATRSSPGCARHLFAYRDERVLSTFLTSRQ